MGKNQEQYFATLTDATYIDELKTKVTDYRQQCASSGLNELWGLSLGNYYGMQPDGKVSWRVSQAGDAGELVQMKVNEYGSYVRHEVTLAVQQRPAGMAKAVNADPDTLRNARIGTQLVEYYLTDPAHKFESDYVRSLLLALLSAEALVVQDWDPNVGEQIMVDDQGKPINSGDITQTVYAAWDAARDWRHPDGKAPWYIFSKRTLKWNLAAIFPAYAEEIIHQSSTNLVAETFFGNPSTDDSDYIEEFYFVHFPCPAVRNGRVTRFTNDVIFLDSEYPYGFRNVHRITDQDMIQSSHGHTSNYDLLGLEQVTDCLDSIILNNLSTFGIATIVGPKSGEDGTNGLYHKDLGKGLRYIEVEPQFVDKIKPLDLCKIPSEIFGYKDSLSAKKGELSGINSILRGDPQGALKDASGSAMALLQSQALIYNSGVQQSFYSLLSSAGTGIIELCRANADEERMFRIAGKASQEHIDEFKYTRQTLEAISTVVFEPVNPAMQTTAGKMLFADKLAERGQLENPKDYIELATTGNLSVLLDPNTAARDLILDENIWLARGETVQVIATENHKDHIARHSVLFASARAKHDLKSCLTGLSHIQAHLDMWIWLSANNPALLIATNQDVLPIGPGMAVPQTPPPGAPVSSAPQVPSQPMPVPGESSPGEQVGNQPVLPKPPTDPGTGEYAMVAPQTTVRQAA